MENFIDPVAFVGFAGMPMIVAIVQLLKLPFAEDGVPSWVWTYVSVGVAVVLNLLLGWYTGVDWLSAAVTGVVVGLASAGLYDAAKIATQFVKQ